MPHLGEFLRRLGADALGRRVGADELGKTRLDRIVAPPQRVVFGIGNGRRILLVVAPVVRADLLREARKLLLRLRCGQLVDRDVSGGACTHGKPGSSSLGGRPRAAWGSAAHEPAHPAAALISRSAAARASSVISAPASMRAISSRRRSAATSAMRVVIRLPRSSALLVMR